MSRHLDFGREGSETLNSLLEGLQVIGFDWTYLYVNGAAVKQNRFYSKEDLLGYTMMEKNPGIEATPLFAILQNCMINRVSEQFDTELTFPDNSRGWFQLRIEPVPEGILILSLDVTQKKQAEEDTHQYIHGLEKMLYLTSHRLRQPVANILGVSTILRSSENSPAELTKIAGYMRESAVLLDSFTKELTSFIADLKSMRKNQERARSF